MDPDAPAGDVLVLRTQPVRDGLFGAAGRLVAALFVMAFAGDGADAQRGPAVPCFFVVARRDTGEELLRLRSDLHDGDLEEHLADQLRTLTAGGFCDEWGIAASAR
jgi:hypothetical protein